MALIFLYGPPAVGKLTIANEISKLNSEYKVFDNHSTINLIKKYQIFEDANFHELSNEMRSVLFKSFAKNRLNIITTFCLSDSKEDLDYITNIIDIYKNKDEIYFIKLWANIDVLKNRISNEDRKEMQKMTQADELEKFMAIYNFDTILPNTLLSIRTDNLEPNESAKKILDIINE
jgi:shikimate kinase